MLHTTWMNWRAHARLLSFTCGLLGFSASLAPPLVQAQTEISSGYVMADEMVEQLRKKADLTLRDTNFVEAMFVVRRVWGVNVVVGNELKGETVSCEFTDTPLHEILDTILLPRGYGYKPVGSSLVVVKLDAIGDLKPRFQSTTVPVKYADPAELERVATLYLSPHGKIQIIPSAKSILVVDYPEQILQVKAKIEEIDAAAKLITEAEEAKLRKAEEIAMNAANSAATGTGPAMVPGSNNKVAFFDLQFAKAEAIAPAVQPLLNSLGRVSVMTKDNRLIVYDTEDKLAMIADAIRQLDVPRPQVRIAALIYDVSIEDIRRMGVNWGNTGGKGNNLTDVGSAQDSAIFNALTAAAPTGANSSLTFTSLGSNFDLNVVVNALATARDSRLLADPNVVIYDQEIAKIDSVREIPYQQLTQSAQGGTIGTTAFREAGITLTVTPQVSSDDTLTLLVNPKFSVLAGLTSGTNQPIIDRREYSGTVRVSNRETIVIGGMRQREFNKTRAGVPYLMNIKHIGELFKNKDVTVRESELVVFLTPEILNLNYLGREREHAIYNCAVPSLDSIMHPRIPELPCPIEDWKCRCGFPHHQYKDGCEHCRRRREAHQQKQAAVQSGAQQTDSTTTTITEYAPQANTITPTQVPESYPNKVAPPINAPTNTFPNQQPAPVHVEEIPQLPKSALEIPDANSSRKATPSNKQASRPLPTPQLVRESLPAPLPQSNHTTSPTTAMAATSNPAPAVQMVTDRRLNVANPLRKTIAQTVDNSELASAPLPPTPKFAEETHAEPALLPAPGEVVPTLTELKRLPSIMPRSIFVRLPPITQELAD